MRYRVSLRSFVYLQFSVPQCWTVFAHPCYCSRSVRRRRKGRCHENWSRALPVFI